jgi:hypothetical protein
MWRAGLSLPGWAITNMRLQREIRFLPHLGTLPHPMIMQDATCDRDHRDAAEAQGCEGKPVKVDFGAERIEFRSTCTADGSALPQVLDCRARMGHAMN